MFIASPLVFVALFSIHRQNTNVGLFAGIFRLLFLPSLPPYQSQQGRRHIAELKTKRIIDARNLVMKLVDFFSL